MSDLERPIQLVFPLEIISGVKEDKENHNASTKENVGVLEKRPERRAALRSLKRILKNNCRMSKKH